MFKLRVWLRRYTAGFVVGWEKRYPTDFSVSWEPRRLLESLSVHLTVRGKVTTLLTFDGSVRRMWLAMRKGTFWKGEF
jgi:hypothetical protein